MEQKAILPSIHQHTKWGRYDQSKVLDVAKLHRNKVCRSAIRYILDVGNHAWRKCKQSAATNILPYYGNENLRSGKGRAFNELVRDDFHEYFAGLQLLSETQPTRVIRYTTGYSLRDDLERITYIQNYFSKRGIHTRFCNERGWDLEYLEMEVYKATVINNNFLPICSRYKFQIFWKQQYPKLRLGSTAEDMHTATTFSIIGWNTK